MSPIVVIEPAKFRSESAALTTYTTDTTQVVVQGGAQKKRPRDPRENFSQERHWYLSFQNRLKTVRRGKCSAAPPSFRQLFLPINPRPLQ